MNPAPIVLFACNRPVHTRRTLESLRQNPLAASSELLIVCDGPRPDAESVELDRIRQVREIARSTQWCGTTQVIENKENIRLPNQLPPTLDRLFEKHDRLIILEDDLLLSPGFLDYMNTALELYKDDELVMHVSGYVYPVREPLDETSFLIFSSNWGWGTWRRAWKKFIADPEKLLELYQDAEQQRLLNMDGVHDYYSVLKRCAATSWKSWDIRWYGTVRHFGGLCLHPGRSLVQNIGTDDSGVNCGDDDLFKDQPIAERIEVRRLPVMESVKTRNAYKEFHKLMDKTDVVSKMKSIARNVAPPVITFFFTGNREEAASIRSTMRSFMRTLVPPVVRKFRPAPAATAPVTTLPSTEEYWSEHSELLESWGQGNAWNEIETLLFEKKGKVLDIACGTGPVIKLLEKYPALEVHGIDNNAFLVEKARGKGIAANRLTVGDATDLSAYADQAFDYTCSLGLIYYFDDAQLDRFLAGLVRITRTTSYHFILCNKGIKDQEWIFTWQKYRNNSASWWKQKMESHFPRVQILNSSWKDTAYNRSKGIWLVCHQQPAV